MRGSLYDRIGGHEAVFATVTAFYDRVMADPSLSPFFQQLDMGAQVDKQVAFLTMAFGGPSRYTGRDLRTAHAGLLSRGLGDQHFDAIARHLAATLTEAGVAPELVSEVIAHVETTRPDVLGR